MVWLMCGSVLAIALGNLWLRACFVARYASSSQAPLLYHWQVWSAALILLAGLIVWIAATVFGSYHWGYVALSVSSLLMVVGAWWLLGETLTLGKLCGALVIMLGTIILVLNSGL